jgi:hypothetical protein
VEKAETKSEVKCGEERGDSEMMGLNMKLELLVGKEPTNPT